MTIFFDWPLSSFRSTENSVVRSAAGTTISPSITADAALMCQASWLTFLNWCLANRRHLRNRGSQSRLDEAGQRGLDTDRLGFLTLKRHE